MVQIWVFLPNRYQQEYDDSVTLFSLEAQIYPGRERISCSSTYSDLLTPQGLLETPTLPIFSDET